MLPQLVSRISHGNDSLFEVLEKVLLKVMAAYPHHTFWSMASGVKSVTQKRSKRCTRVFEKAKVCPPLSLVPVLTIGTGRAQAGSVGHRRVQAHQRGHQAGRPTPCSVQLCRRQGDAPQSPFAVPDAVQARSVYAHHPVANFAQRVAPVGRITDGNAPALPRQARHIPEYVLQSPLPS